MKLFSLVGLTPAWKAAGDTRRYAVIEGATLEEVARLERLAEAWKKVRANKGGPGADGVTLDAFGERLDKRLLDLSHNLLAQTYRPGSLRQATMPKRNGGRRKLRIPCVADRILQTATLLTLAPITDPRMSDASWAYRPGRGVADAVERVRMGIGEGFTWTVDADISEYFDRVPHKRLIDELSIWIDDERIIRLFGLWLRGFSRSGRGIAQGSPISPLLANLYLHPVDRQIGSAGFRVVRYADDLVIQTGSEVDAKAALGLLAELLKHRGLSLNLAKTQILPPARPLEFLGEAIDTSSAGAPGIDM